MHNLLTNVKSGLATARTKYFMQLQFKHTPIGYFRYFYNALGNKLLYNLFLSVLLGFFDGIGLALFLPLLQFVNDPKSVASGESMGGMKFVIEGFQSIGVPLNLFTVLGLILLVFLIKALLTYTISMAAVDLRQRYGIGTRLKQLRELRDLSYKGLLDLDAGQIQSAMTVEIGKNVQGMNQFLITMKTAIILSSYVVMAFLANWQFAILIIIGGGLTNFFFKKINENVRDTSFLITERNKIFAGFLIQCINTFKYLKSTNYFEKYYLKLEAVNKETEKLNRKIGKNQAITSSSREPLIMTVVVLVILFQVYVMGSGLGSIILSLLLFYRALGGLMGLQNSWQSFMQNVGAIESLYLFNQKMAEYREDYKGKTNYPGLKNNITLKNLNFFYGKKRTLDHINLEIEKNSTVAFVGESGSGKTTLANIIITLLQPESGEYLVDGVPISNYNLKGFRERIGYITQESIIYNDTIFNNVTFWADKTPENLARFWKIIDQVSMTAFVKASEDAENTIMGDNGMKVSGGQKQRISIARELYKDIDILVMDEATSALDSETEHFIQSNINELQGQFTMIIIAHRLSTVKNADQIILMDHGKILDTGTFEGLQTTSSKFENMVALQNLHTN